jgi:flavin-dependent dehydrogenase
VKDAVDVFVIGGGPAGLAAAIAARQRGLTVALADCSRPPIEKPCGEGVMPDGIEAARALHGETGVEASFPAGVGLGVRRTVLHRRMVERAADAGVELRWGARVSGISERGVVVDGSLVRAGWMVGADGGQSMVRRWAGLDGSVRDKRRFGFRRHYRVAPWSGFMELHWGDGCQFYITPVSEREVCVVSISRDPKLRMDDALPQFPALAARLGGCEASDYERGAVSATRQLKRVCDGRVALVGDASGSVDAITGEGLCLLFQQATALADAMEAGDLSRYADAHRRIGRRPRVMADLMLLMDDRKRLRSAAIGTLAAQPWIFGGMLRMHVGGTL